MRFRTIIYVQARHTVTAHHSYQKSRLPRSYHPCRMTHTGMFMFECMDFMIVVNRQKVVGNME